MTWRHTGGGTEIGTDNQYPSDDSYKNTVTGEVVTVQCTIAAHFSMPFEVDDIADVLALEGVLPTDE